MEVKVEIPRIKKVVRLEVESNHTLDSILEVVCKDLELGRKELWTLVWHCMEIPDYSKTIQQLGVKEGDRFELIEKARAPLEIKVPAKLEKLSRRRFLKYAVAGLASVGLSGVGVYYVTMLKSSLTGEMMAETKTLTATPTPETTPIKKPFEGQMVTAACMAGGPEGPHSSVLYHFEKEWENLTGADLRIVEIPLGELHEKVMTDVVTGAGVYDTFKICATSLGDLVVGGNVIPLDDYMKDPKYPKWDPRDVPEAVRRCVTWG
ncbi:MAG: hypothetical protein QXR65_07650, partial [Candidatus Bathyarchaeia archaeon]